MVVTTRLSSKSRNQNRFTQQAEVRRKKAVDKRQQNARQKSIRNARARLTKLGFYRKKTFIDIVSKITRIDPGVLDEHIYFSGSPGKHTEVSFDLGHSMKWSCLLFFQYIDMVHDNGSQSTPALGSWEKFCDMVQGSHFYKPEDVTLARKFVRNEIVWLVKNKVCKKNYLSCLSDMYRQQEDVYFFHNVLRIMIVYSHFARKDGILRLYSKPDERGILVNVLKFVSRYSSRFQTRKKNVQIRVKGHELLSLDMTNGGRLKDFTASYHKYLHVINFGDKGKFFLPERDIGLIIKQIIRRDITNKSLYNNTANIQTVNNNNNNRPRTNNNRSIHTVHYNDDPLKLSIGSLNVYVFNQIVKTPSDDTFVKIKQMLEPNIVYRNDTRNVFVQEHFVRKSENVDKNTLKDTYANLLSKHMGDFLNAVNSIYNNVVFASGDSLACVGYLISVALIPGAVSRLLWEDATNEKIWLVSDKTTDVNHFRKITMSSRPQQEQRSAVPGAVAVSSSSTTTTPALLVPVVHMSSKVSDRTDSFLSRKLEKETEIFEGLFNLGVNLNRLNRLPNNYKLKNSGFSDFKHNYNLQINSMAEAPARFTQ